MDDRLDLGHDAQPDRRADRPAGAATLTVFGYDPLLAGPVRVGGDHLHVGTYVTDLMTIDGRARVTRLDGKSWADAGFVAGRRS